MLCSVLSPAHHCSSVKGLLTQLVGYTRPPIVNEFGKSQKLAKRWKSDDNVMAMPWEYEIASSIRNRQG